MNTTVFVSSVEISDESHPLCGCEVKIYDQSENLIGYITSTWGEHQRPDCPELIEHFVCDYLEVDNILASKGWHRKIEMNSGVTQIRD